MRAGAGAGVSALGGFDLGFVFQLFPSPVLPASRTALSYEWETGVMDRDQ